MTGPERILRQYNRKRTFFPELELYSEFDDHWRRAADIATAASELPPTEVDEFLKDRCPTAALREEVEALLATKSQTEGALPGNRASTRRRRRAERTAEAAPPREIGPYRFLRSLGAGGMGEVFLARQQEPIEREVAIKLIASKTGSAGYRFELERRALARMRHPYVAQIYEAGTTDDGQPFLAMEFIDGAPMDRYCNEKGIPFEKRLRLFCAVCDGIHHAHQKGLLHRDVKPDNVLITEIDGEPIPKIIDFGIAKDIGQDIGQDLEQDLDPRYRTGDGLLGTPAYASPEAILNPSEDVDIRSDVYSLGILLYRLLVGSIPFDAESKHWFELVRSASSRDTPTITSLLLAEPAEKRSQVAASCGFGSDKALIKKLRPDLDAIAQMATARNKDTRYDSAAALAGDIRRYLDNRPIRARPAGPWGEAKKFIRRHRTGVLAAALVMLSLVGGLIARTFEARRADRAAAEALQAQEDTKQVVDFLVSLFEVSDPERSLGATITARELLEKGAERARTELGQQPLARARLLDTIGVVYDNLGLYDQSGELLDEALEIRADSGGPLEIAESHMNLGRLRLQEADTTRAEDHFEKALEIRRRELGPDHPRVADVLDVLGQLLEVEADYGGSKEMLEQALTIRERNFGLDSEPVIETLNNLAILAHNQGGHEEAERSLRRVVESRERLHGPDHPKVARALNGLANALERQDKGVEAEKLFRRSLAIRLATFGPIHAEVGQSFTNLANSLLDQGREDEALEYMKRSIHVLEQAQGPKHPSLAIAVHNLGDFYREQSNLAEAEPLLRRSLAIFAETRGPDHPHTAYSAASLGQLLTEKGELDEAETHLRRAYEIRFASLPPGNGLIGNSGRDLAELLRLTGREPEARKLEVAYPDPDSGRDSGSGSAPESDSDDEAS